MLWMAWPASGFAPLLLIAFVPLFILEEKILAAKKQGIKIRLFKWNYLCFLLFNLLTTWWIWYASNWGMMMAVACNALFMAAIFQLFHLTRLRLGNFSGYTSLIFYWTAFEYMHLNWNLSWPWLNLGNGFASLTSWIQWYECSGTLGGTFWILSSNILLFDLFRLKQKFNHRKLFAWTLVIFIPIIISKVIAANYSEEEQKAKSIVVVQPNIDPYNEKFAGMSAADQLNKILRLASSLTDSATDYVVCPETALPEGIWEHELAIHPDIEALRDFIKPFPHLHLVTGLASNRLYREGDRLSATARKLRDKNFYYDSYNTGMQLDNSGRIQLYHKSKLVIGVEALPFNFLEPIAINLGGASGSLGIQPEPSVFFSADSTGIAPVICYESVYGEYVSEYVKKGANAIFIITNDGWWHDTPGYRQHCQYARLRAIETRRSIARSANTGISCFINQLGEISQPTKWWTDDVIKHTIHLNKEQTFYTKHGDYIGRIASFCSALVLIVLIGIFVKKRRE